MNSLFFHSVYSFVFIKFAMVSSDPLPPFGHVNQSPATAAYISYLVIYFRLALNQCSYLLSVLGKKHSSIGGDLVFIFPDVPQKSSNFNGSPKCSSTKREQKSTPVPNSAPRGAASKLLVFCAKMLAAPERTMAHYSVLPGLACLPRLPR